MSGTRVTAEDVETGETETIVIENDYVLICDGLYYVAGTQSHSNGTTVLTIKRRES